MFGDSSGKRNMKSHGFKLFYFLCFDLPYLVLSVKYVSCNETLPDLCSIKSGQSSKIKALK